MIWIDLDYIRTESEDLEDEDEIRDLTAEHTLDHHDHRFEKNLFHLLKLLQDSDLNSHIKILYRSKISQKRRRDFLGAHTSRVVYFL